MPRFVRPSFVELSVDGRKSTISAGPNRRTGSMRAEFTVRQDAEFRPALSVELIAYGDGTMVRLVVTDGFTGAIILDRGFRQ